MLHLLLDTKLNQEQLDYANTMRISSDGLLSIITDILDFRYVFSTSSIHVSSSSSFSYFSSPTLPPHCSCTRSKIRAGKLLLADEQINIEALVSGMLSTLGASKGIGASG